MSKRFFQTALVRIIVASIFVFLITIDLLVSFGSRGPAPAPRLYKLHRISDSVANINRGGCGYFALKLYQKLQTTSSRDSFEIISIDTNYHIMLHRKGTEWYLDSDGYTDFKDIYCRSCVFDTISEDVLKYLVLRCKWNPKFNRADTAKINRLIDSI